MWLIKLENKPPFVSDIFAFPNKAQKKGVPRRGKKKRKKTESIEEKKFLSARKKVKHSGMWKTKEGGLYDAHQCSRSFIGFKQSGNHLTRNVANLFLPIRREVIDENKGKQMSEDKHAYM